MDQRNTFVCDTANKLLDLYLDPLDNPQEGEIEKATSEYVMAVLTPLFEPIAVMPRAERGPVIVAVVNTIRSMTRLLAETALEHQEPENDPRT